MTIQQLMQNQTPGGRALLAAEILTKQGRQDGPAEDKCDHCGFAWPRGYTLDWMTLEWQCQPCAIDSMLTARGEVPMEMVP